MKEKIVFRRAVSIAVCAALILTSCFMLPSYADKTVLSPKIYYHLDMGVQLAYNNGSDWGSQVYGKDSSGGTWPLDMGTDVEVVDVYPYEGSGYNIDNGSNNVGGQANYDRLYQNYVSTFMSVSDFSSTGHNISFTYSAKLNTPIPLDVVEMGVIDQDNKVYELFGNKARLESEFPEIADAVELALAAGHNGTAGSNKLYLVFCPNVIEYRKYVTMGDLEADLNLPESAKQGESFTVEDATSVDSSLTLESSAVRYRVDNGAWKDLITWLGDGTSGTNSGGQIQQKFDAICKVDYEITATATNGQTSKKTKSINIVDSRNVDATASLELPEFTYEGHPALAKDVSTFTVDGISYSATRAYEEGIADNDFDPNSSYGSVDRLTDTKADVTYSKRGTYSVTLYVNPVNFDTLTDTKPIEVRKTPYILDSLGGFQKENRKQILTASVATYPGKPITDYYVELKDLKTNQSITLTAAQPQVNNATIKTRTIQKDGDEYWTNFTLEFLTKNTAEQQYQYTIYMKDSKGDTDTVQKIFTVKPDLPPDPVIVMQDSFIRNKGTNVAEITTEDASTTDGDQLERSWSVGGKDLKSFDGYKDLAFGTGQKVQFNKVGVGKTDVKLFVKDVWIEPTLEEYVTDADRKTAEITKTTDVINIAPTVRLEPKNMKEADITIVTDKSNKTALADRLNSLKAALIEKGFDPRISLAVAPDADAGPYRRVATWEWDTAINCGICQRNAGQMDSDYVYRITSPGKVTQNYYEVCVNGPHVLQALSAGTAADSGRIVWSYPVNQSRNFNFYLDNREKYVYIACFDINKTIILNRDNGAYLTTLNMAIPGAPFIDDDAQRLYFIGTSAITKYDTSTGAYSTVMNRGGSLARMMNGTITFVGKKETGSKTNPSGTGFYIGAFDTKTETVRETAVPDLPSAPSAVTPVDIDSAGKVLFRQGTNLWVADTQKYTVKMTNTAGTGDYMNSTVFVRNEKDEGVYVAHAYASRPSTYKVRFYFNLYDFSETALNSVASYSSDAKGLDGNPISYAKLHSRENKIYIMQGSVSDSTAGSQWAGNGYMFSINLPSMAIDINYMGLGWDVADEDGAYNGSLIRTFYLWERWIGTSDRIKLFRNSITESEAKTAALRKNAQSGNGDSEKYIVVAGNDSASQILNNQEFKNEIDLKGARGLFLNVKNSIISIADQIEDLGNSLKNYLLLEGDNFSNLSSVTHEIKLQPDTEYEYKYDMTATGTAVDLFGVINPNSQGAANDNKYFEKTAGHLDVYSGTPEPFFTLSGGSVLDDGYGYGTEAAGTNSFATSFTMEHEGYFTFDVISPYSRNSDSHKDVPNTITIYVDGVIASNAITSAERNSTVPVPVKIYLTAGAHTIRFEHYADVGRGWELDAGINNLKAVYYYDTVNGFVPKTLSEVKEGQMQAVSGSFRVDGQETFQVLKETTAAASYKTKAEYDKYIKTTAVEGSWTFDAASKVYHYTMKNQYADDSLVTFTITAPSNKALIYSLSLYYDGGTFERSTGYCSFNGKAITYADPKYYVLQPGASATITAECSYKKSSWLVYPVIDVSNIKIAEVDLSKLGISSLPGAIDIQNLATNRNGTMLMKFENAANGVTNIKITRFGNLSVPSSLNTGIQLSTSESAKKISALVSNFSLYQKIGGVKQLIFSQNFNSQNVLNLTGWKTSVKGTGKAQIVSAKPSEKEEISPMVYKKGQLVAYNIFYDDYENDPSQKQFWRYTHTPYNDGPHPDAAVILDEDGKVVSSTGKVLSESIPRFYIDGKYTVEHWQMDNTNRTGDTSGKVDYTKYDKVSNVESLTFYIEGGGTAPWITSIKTVPAAVKEGDKYKLQIGVDDAEKDELRLTTELYKDKKLIYTHKQTGLVADTNGNYPFTTTGYAPAAAPGVYDVVCTVRDWSGAGIGTYRFTVVSEGKITGLVNHTDQWDDNRKKYNLKRFGEEVNRTMQLDDYIALATPRMRGSNVFWSGEKFMLRAETEGKPSRVEVCVQSVDGRGVRKNAGYSTELRNTGKKTAAGAELWEGSLWDRAMINKWGRKNPEPLYFIFTAYYAGGAAKTDEAMVIIDSRQDYWQLHRLW